MWLLNRSLPVQLCCIEMIDLRVTENQDAYEMLKVCAESYRSQNEGMPISEVYGVQHARRFFRAVGLDPTKRRPSSEALLRRALKGKSLFSVNSLVDAGNWCSLDFLMPICIYDASNLDGDVEIRMGTGEDVYEALNGETISFENRYVFADETGAFGSPMTDSVRTAVSEKTKHAWLVLFSPVDFDEETLRENGEVFVERVQSICGGNCVDVQILKGRG